MTDPKNLSEAIQNMEHDRHVDRRQKWWLFTVSGLLFVASVVIAVLAWQLSLDRDASKREAATEQQQKQEYAQELQTVLCEKDDVEIYDADRCAELTAVATEPSRTETGPQGVQGVQGPRGRDGVDGEPGPLGPVGPQGPQGPQGLQGPQGIAGLLGSAGANGLNGLDGAQGPPGPLGPVGPAGPAGPAGKDGNDGAPGAPGMNGRGIATIVCEGAGDGSYWVVTYDDGTAQTSDGPCRLASIPLPTEAP